ncbi:MAG: hypothetical protein Q9178_003955 [Gyalolechia marmorata]
MESKHSYECQAAAQQRPYVSRPSRTQQLANPTLRPKLNSDVPNDLLRKTGVADEQLEKIERDRKRKSHVDSPIHGTNKRSRSVSSHSSSSVSTISTNLSRSPSPKQATSYKAYQTHDPANGTGRYRTRRSRDSSMSYSSDASYKRHRRTGSSDRDQAFPTKLGSASGLRVADRGANQSITFDVLDRVAPRMDRSQVARERRSMTPVRASRGDGIEPARAGRGKKEVVDARFGSDNDRYGSSFRNREYDDRRAERPKPAPPPRKQRSLSPFSKRVALTQAMNMGR